MGDILPIWLLAGAVVVLAAVFTVVGIARRMDRGDPAIRVKLPAGLRNALGVASGGDARPRKTRQAAIVLAVAAVLIALLGAAILRQLGDRPEPVSSEISAGALHGTLLSARDSDPVVLIVPGSGPTDRDGNGPMIRTDAYKLLAEGLAREGIASVRVDKRGMFGSAGAGDPNAVTPAIYAGDYRAWIDAIRERRGARCIFLLGHSEGALMATLAAEGRKDVCGLILVAGAGRPMGEVIREQLRANPANAPLLADAFRALDELEAGRRIDVAGMHPALQQLFAPGVQDYLIATLGLDPVEALRRADRPTLILQGETDIQVSVEDARRLDKAPRTKLRIIEGMNHVLKAAPADRAANLATYADPALPLHPKLIGRIEDFVEEAD